VCSTGGLLSPVPGCTPGTYSLNALTSQDVPTPVEITPVPNRDRRFGAPEWFGDCSKVALLQSNCSKATLLQSPRAPGPPALQDRQRWRYSRSSPREMIVFWISDVPSPISRNGASRISRSISYSFE